MTALPEISAAEVTADRVREGILGSGALVVRGLIGEPAVERLRSDIDRAFAARSLHPKGAPWYQEYERGLSEGERRWVAEHGGVLAADSPATLADLMDVYERGGILDVLSEYLGEPPVLSAKKTTLRRVDASVGTDWWHQDGAFLGTHIRTLNIWLSLSDCGVDAPGLDLLARRVTEIIPTGTEGADFGWSVSRDVAERVAGDDIVRPVFAPGDALLLDNFTLHQTGVDPSMRGVRYAIEAWFFAASTPPNDWVPIEL